MHSDHILDALRPLVMVVNAAGSIIDARGGYGGFYGYDADSLVGANVFDLIPAHHTDELATYFLESGERSAEAASLPMPFRVTFLDADGREHLVDVIPTGRVNERGDVDWIVVVIPIALHTAVSRSLEAEMAGASRDEVRRALTEELAVDNEHYTSRWFLIDLDTPAGATVTTARPEEEPMARAIRREVIRRGWRPWGPVAAGDTAPVPVDELPGEVRAIAERRRWRRVAVTPVHVEGALVAAYLQFGRVPDDYDVTRINTNVRARIRRLADVTALLIARWHDRDRLVDAATRDPLTGLANRDTFADALAAADGGSTLLYIDIDHFKAINDRHGHTVGDQLLVEISRRIVATCRPSDVVARLGGDEFAVLLDGIDVEHGREIGQRIVESVSAPLDGSDDLPHLSISVGLAPLDAHDDAVCAADAAMLRAKRSGRGKLVAAEPRSSGSPDDPGRAPIGPAGRRVG